MGNENQITTDVKFDGVRVELYPDKLGVVFYKSAHPSDVIISRIFLNFSHGFYLGKLLKEAASQAIAAKGEGQND